MITHAPRDLSALDDARLAAALADRRRRGAPRPPPPGRRRPPTARPDAGPRPPPGRRRRRAGVARGGPRRGPPGRRDPVRGGRRRPRPPDRGPRLDHRPARRHPRVRRATATTARWRDDFAVHVALWRARRAAWPPAPSRCPRAACVLARAPRSPADARPPRAVLDGAPPAPRSPSAARRPPEVAGAAGRARRRGAGPDGLDRRQGRRACSTGPSTPTSTPAASTSGTRRPRSRSRWRPGSSATRLDGSPLVYNQPEPVVARPRRLPPGARRAPATAARRGRRRTRGQERARDARTR